MGGLKPLRHFRGLSQWGGGAVPPRTIFQATFQPQADRDTFAALEWPFHLIFTPLDGTHMLFDLNRDPASKTDIFAIRSRDLDIQRLQRSLEASAREILKNRPESRLDDRTREMLKALGYIK
jgi:hypothetical protein